MAVRTPDDVELEGPHHVGVQLNAMWNPQGYRLSWFLVVNPYTAVPAWSWYGSHSQALLSMAMGDTTRFPEPEYSEILDNAVNISPLLLALEVAAVADGFARVTDQLVLAPKPEKKLDMRAWQSGLRGILASLAREAGTDLKRMSY